MEMMPVLLNLLAKEAGGRRARRLGNLLSRPPASCLFANSQHVIINEVPKVPLAYDILSSTFLLYALILTALIINKGENEIP